MAPDDNPPQKDAIRDFYAAEAAERDTQAWLREGGGARVPENPASHYFLDRKVSTALAMTSTTPASKVLEVGSSFGHQTFLLTGRFAHVTAVDLSPESISLARRRAEFWKVPNVRFEVADAEDLRDFADGAFDLVLSFSTLRFCPDPARALREFRRVVRPGGRLVVDFPNADCPWYGPLKRAIGLDPHIHDRLFTAAEARGIVAEAGWQDVRLRNLLFTTKRAPTALLPAFRLLDAVGERLPGLKSWSGILMVSGVRDGAR
jgi:ubiquinone/menaquinone biosynthesis C-methylase UbiE